MTTGHRYGNTTEKARKAKAKSPWNRGPMCPGHKALRSFKEYKRRGSDRPPTEEKGNG